MTGTELGLAHWKVAPTSIILSANLTEAGTEVVETATSRTIVVHQALKLEFAPHTPKYFKLGLPYHGKVRYSDEIFLLCTQNIVYTVSLVSDRSMYRTIVEYYSLLENE